MTKLAEVQDAFTRALFDADQPVPRPFRGAARRKVERRFAVYRNNVVSGLVDALAQRFPVVSRLVGEEFFRAMARVYVVQRPPVSTLLMLYGETFPDFIEAFAPAAAVPYLGDVARLEIARGRAYHAADAAPVDPAAFSALRGERLQHLSIALHPSVSIIASPYPIVSIWNVNSNPDHAAPISPWAAEAALVARPFMDVEVRRLPAGGAVFLSRLACGGTVGEAIAAATAAAADFDVVENVVLLLGANIVTRLAAHVVAKRSRHRDAARRVQRRAPAARHETQAGVILA